ncbi:MAG: hypothetical protein KGN00_01840 [Chloroflexota bacterium]|nr:hypothetical protein [Chloroflexota bacterium]MDE3192406.1 hypothetical protein [Chloroflexota bacterium]
MADMTGATGGLDARLAELESRLREMERREREAGPLRSFFNELFPSEVRDHLHAAQKEQLLAVRAMLDRMIEKTEEHGAPRGRERISVD